MGRSVRISEEGARALEQHLGRYGADRTSPLGRACSELQRAIARLDRIPKSKPKSKDVVGALRFRATTSCPSRKPSKEEKRDRRAGIREKVFKRAEVDGTPRCEGPGRLESLRRPEFRQVYGRCEREATELAHAFGKGAGRMPESERNCTAYCHPCAVAETNNRPSGEFWWSFRMAFFLAHGFDAEAQEAGKRLSFVVDRAALPAAPRVRP